MTEEKSKQNVISQDSINEVDDETISENMNSNNQDMIQNDNQDLLKKLHRRKQQEITKEFICGDINCKKKYGTNAALYTHVKLKHKGIEPEGTIRPQSEQLSGHRGRPLQHGSSKKLVLDSTYKDVEQKESKNETLKLFSNQHFIDIVHQLGVYGLYKQKNLFTREIDEEYEIVNEQDIDQLQQQIYAIFQTNQEIQPLTDIQKKIIIKISHFWNQKVKQELTFCFIYAIFFQGKEIDKLINYILEQKNEKIDFKVIKLLLENKTDKDFEKFLNQIFKHML